jgi:hypothetical protein
LADKFNGGDTFPTITLSVSGGDTRTLPDDLTAPFAILLFYRGQW